MVAYRDKKQRRNKSIDSCPHSPAKREERKKWKRLIELFNDLWIAFYIFCGQRWDVVGERMRSVATMSWWHQAVSDPMNSNTVRDSQQRLRWSEGGSGRFGRELQINDYLRCCAKASRRESTPNTNGISPDDDRWCRLYWRRECKRQAAGKRKIDSECVSVVNQLWKYQFSLLFLLRYSEWPATEGNRSARKILPNMKMDWIRNELEIAWQTRKKNDDDDQKWSINFKGKKNRRKDKFVWLLGFRVGSTKRNVVEIYANLVRLKSRRFPNIADNRSQLTAQNFWITGNSAAAKHNNNNGSDEIWFSLTGNSFSRS